MGRPSHLNWLLAASILLAGCSSSALRSAGDQDSKAAIERLELRLNQLERQLNDFKGTAPPAGERQQGVVVVFFLFSLGEEGGGGHGLQYSRHRQVVYCTRLRSSISHRIIFYHHTGRKNTCVLHTSVTSSSRGGLTRDAMRETFEARGVTALAEGVPQI